MTYAERSKQKYFILARQTMRRHLQDDEDLLRAYQDNVSVLLQDRFSASIGKQDADDAAMAILELVLGFKEDDFKFCVHCASIPQEVCPNLVEVRPGGACQVAE